MVAGLAATVLSFVTVACSGGEQPAPTAQPSGDCPAEPLSVVVSVDQWGSIVSQLAGECATVNTVVSGSSVDPHDFEPAPKDAALFEDAQLIVVNGGHYDEWATKLAAGSAPDAPVIDAVELSGGAAHAEESNPHVWYNPAAVTAVADAVTAEFAKLAPAAEDYFTERHAEFGDSLATYHQIVGSLKATAGGKTYAATESVFDEMAAAVGLVNRTPPGYQAAAAHESDPSPADLDAFLRLLGDRGVDVLIYNVQTEGSVPQQIRAAAEQAGVPVVEVTESMPPGADSFESWQVGQLSALAEALGVGG
ncbi:metal ABC transporter solute-binding protein, Zn/Mn family [Mycolicibacterium litorale]|uniref:metal ABC transporter solute-binding protein, Zn/Mn family n=1 Tax=Mycolicibacterium litorale TaxID=758802 RepID=UPI0023DFB9A3